jgi:hypothetical protein
LAVNVFDPGVSPVITNVNEMDVFVVDVVSAAQLSFAAIVVAPDTAVDMADPSADDVVDDIAVTITMALAPVVNVTAGPVVVRLP